MLIEEYGWLAVFAAAGTGFSITRFLYGVRNLKALKVDLLDIAALIISGFLAVAVSVNSYGEDTVSSAGTVIINAVTSNAWLALPYFVAAILDFLLVIPAVFIFFATAFRRRGKKGL